MALYNIIRVFFVNSADFCRQAVKLLIDGLFPQLSLFIDSVKEGNIWENMI